MSKPKNMARTIYVRSEDWKRWDDLAYAARVSRSEYIRRAVEAYGDERHVCRMPLCEAEHVALRTDLAYHFYVMPGCTSCEAAYIDMEVYSGNHAGGTASALAAGAPPRTERHAQDRSAEGQADSAAGGVGQPTEAGTIASDTLAGEVRDEQSTRTAPRQASPAGVVQSRLLPDAAATGEQEAAEEGAAGAVGKAQMAAGRRTVLSRPRPFSKEAQLGKKR